VTNINQVLYTPDVDFEGWDRCTYKVCLGALGNGEEDGGSVDDSTCNYARIKVKVVAGPTSKSEPVTGRPGDEGAEADAAMTSFAGAQTVTAVDDGAVTSSNVPVKVDVAANDPYEGPDGLVPVVIESTNALHGTCRVVTNINQVLYTPDVDFEGWDRCTYKVCLGALGNGEEDGGSVDDSTCNYARIKVKVVAGPKSEDMAEPEPSSRPTAKPTPLIAPVAEETDGPTVEPTRRPTPEPTPRVAPAKDATDDGPEDITMFAYNLDPVARPDSVTVLQNEYAYIDVLANDFDPEGEELRVYSWTSPGMGGEAGYVERREGVSVAGYVERRVGVIRYQPPGDGFVGEDSFEYTVCDISYRCDSAMVTVNVISEVFAVDDEATTFDTAPVYVNVTANDYTSSNLPLVLTDVNRARHGTCEIVGVQVRYTPPLGGGFEGLDRCAYMVCSGDECDKGRVEVRVLPTQIYNFLPETTGNDNGYRPFRPVAEPEEDAPIPLGQPVQEDSSESSDDRPVKPFRPNAEMATGEELEDGPIPASQQAANETGEGTTGRPIKPNDETSTTPLSPVESVEGGEIQVALEKVYAEDEVVTTLAGRPIIIDVTANDFVKGMGQLSVTRTGGAINGKCKLTNSNKVRYVPNSGFVGRDHCAYVVCQGPTMCDEGIVAIKVVDKEASAKPLSQSIGGSDLVSNHEISSGLSLGLNHKRAGPSSIHSSSSAAAISCDEYNGGGRNLRRGPRRLLPENDPCIESSTAITTSSESSVGSYKIMYTTTQHKTKKKTQYLINSSVLRVGRTVRNHPNDIEDASETYMETIITVPASADAVIMPGFPDRCFGKVPSMLVSSASSSAGLHETMLQFRTSEVDKSVCENGFVSSASIHLYSLTRSSQGGAFVTTSDSTWSEDDVTWNNAPESDGIVLMDRGQPVEAKTWCAVDVSSALILGETLSIRILSIEGTTSVAQYASRDHSNATLMPVLNITCIS